MDIIDQLNCMLIERGMKNSEANEIAESLRNIWSGRVYISKQSGSIKNEIKREIRKNGNFSEIARKFRVSKTTVYRLARQARKNA